MEWSISLISLALQRSPHIIQDPQALEPIELGTHVRGKVAQRRVACHKLVAIIRQVFRDGFESMLARQNQQRPTAQIGLGDVERTHAQLLLHHIEPIHFNRFEYVHVHLTRDHVAHSRLLGGFSTRQQVVIELLTLNRY